MAEFTQDDLANINAAIASGAKQAMIQGEMVQYRDLAEMMRIRGMIKADLEGSVADVSPIQYPETDRGL